MNSGCDGRAASYGGDMGLEEAEKLIWARGLAVCDRALSVGLGSVLNSCHTTLDMVDIIVSAQGPLSSESRLRYRGFSRGRSSCVWQVDSVWK